MAGSNKSIRDYNKGYLVDAKNRRKIISQKKQEIIAKKKKPAYQAPMQQAALQKIIDDLDKADKVLQEEIIKRESIEQSYANSTAADPDSDPVVKVALQALYDHRSAHSKSYSKGKVGAAVIPCKVANKAAKKVKPWVSRTSEKTLKKLNKDLGTNVNFNNLSEFEGGQWHKTYIPCNKKVVAGKSGVSIGTGFDIGQKSDAELKALGLSDTLYKKLKKFANKNYKGKTCDEANKELSALGKVTITQSEADEIDDAVKKEHLKSAITSWDKKPHPTGWKKFTELTEGQQTVIFSRTFHQGKGMPSTKVAKEFYEAARKGDWATAKRKLQDYNVTKDWYKNRVKKEANLL
jgi:hypothetical protein